MEQEKEREMEKDQVALGEKVINKKIEDEVNEDSFQEEGNEEEEEQGRIHGSISRGRVGRSGKLRKVTL